MLTSKLNGSNLGERTGASKIYKQKNMKKQKRCEKSFEERRYTKLVDILQCTLVLLRQHGGALGGFQSSLRSDHVFWGSSPLQVRKFP